MTMVQAWRMAALVMSVGVIGCTTPEPELTVSPDMANQAPDLGSPSAPADQDQEQGLDQALDLDQARDLADDLSPTLDMSASSPLEDAPGLEVLDYKVASKLDGVLWSPSLARTLFNDQQIMQLDSQDQIEALYAPPEGVRHQIKTIDSQGRLLGVEVGEALKIVRFDGQGGSSILAQSYEAGPLPSPNDLAATPEGGLYFTRRKGGPQDGYVDDKGGAGAVFYVGADRQVKVAFASDELLNPNGIALSPDGRWLYVTASSYDDKNKQGVWRFALASDGELTQGQLWLKWERPDGMAVDVEGNLYVTSATTKKVGVFSATGQLWGALSTPVGSLTHCGFAGDDGKTLYITSNTKLMRARLPYVGALFKRGL